MIRSGGREPANGTPGPGVGERPLSTARSSYTGTVIFGATDWR